MKKLVAVLAVTLSFNVMALTIDMKISGHQKILLKKNSKKSFTQFYEESSGRFDMTVEENGQTYNIGQEVPTEITNSGNVSIEVQKKGKSVRFIDLKEEIDQIVPAKVDMTITRKVKSFTINNEVMKALYSKSLEREGISALAGMNINTDELKFSTDFNFSSLDCKKTDEGLQCDQDMSITIMATDNE